MRVLLGLSALAAVSAQTLTPSGNQFGSFANPPPVATSPQAIISVTAVSGGTAVISPAGYVNTGTQLSSNNWSINVPNAVTSVQFTFTTNQYTSQMQYRWFPGYSPQTAYPTAGLSAASYTCDQCVGSTSPVSCNTSVGPALATSGYQCAQLVRVLTFTGLLTANQQTNSMSVQLFDLNQNPAPNVSSFSFLIVRANPSIVGDPQITGLQGQDFQVHGMPDEIFNMITYPNLQVNARFVYLSEGACHDNFTACFAHPGTYISEEGIRLGKDKIHVEAGSFKKGLTVSVNGQKVTKKTTQVKLGSVELVNHRRVVVKTPIMAITISNSDKFLNQETELYDQKLLSLGAERRELLIGEAFHPEVPLHGLQGQTWRNVVYPSGLDYEGSISDYHVTDNNLYGSHFVFNQFKL